MDVSVFDLNSFLECGICNGYLVDATTINDCLHSFCRSCILTHLHGQRHRHYKQQNSTTSSSIHNNLRDDSSPYHCPKCNISLHVSRPETQLHPDHLLQALVYKLVPGLFEQEMQDRRKYFSARPREESLRVSPDKRGEGVHPLKQGRLSQSGPPTSSTNEETSMLEEDNRSFISVNLEYFGTERLFGRSSTSKTLESSAISSCPWLPVIKREPMVALVGPPIPMMSDEFDNPNADNMQSSLCLHFLLPSNAPLSCLACLIQHKLSLIESDCSPVFFLPHTDSLLPLASKIRDVACLAHYVIDSPLTICFAIVPNSASVHQELTKLSHSTIIASSSSTTTTTASTSTNVTTPTPAAAFTPVTNNTTSSPQTDSSAVTHSSQGGIVSSTVQSSSSDDIYDPHRDRRIGCVTKINVNRKKSSTSSNQQKYAPSSSRRKRSRHY